MENKSLNVIKGIACIGVCLIHSSFSSPFAASIKCAFGFSVPFFFLVSGYYCFNCDNEKIKKRIIKNLIFLIELLFIYSIIDIVFINGFNNFLIKVFNVKHILKMLLIGKFNYFNAAHLWFLHALIVDYLLIIIANKKKIIDKVLLDNKFIFLLLIINVISMFIVSYFNMNFIYYNNFITCGFPYFVIGMFINKNTNSVCDINNNIFILLFIIGVLISVISPYYGWTGDQTFGSIISSICIFIFAIKNSNILNRFIYYIGSKLSKYIYGFHYIISILIDYKTTLSGGAIMHRYW